MKTNQTKPNCHSMLDVRRWMFNVLPCSQAIVVFLLPLLLLLMQPTALQAQFYYTTYNGTITITGYTGPGGALTIPGTINGLPVTSIGQGAFYRRTSLTNINIPNTVTSIGYQAFYSCTSLTVVTLGNNLTSIGESAFEFCTSLTSVTIPNNVTNIGQSSFFFCTSLTSVTIGNSVTNIGDYAFQSCTSLATVTIGSNVTTIGNVAFTRCTSLTSVTIPDSVTSIGAGAFQSCPSLTAITVGAFNSAYNSADGVLLNKTKTTLIQCPGGKAGSYTIPNSVTTIGDHAFYSCTSLTNVTIPNSVTSIGYSAFQSCPSLTAVTVGAFNSAYSSVDGVLLNKTKTTLIQCPGGKAGSYTIPNSVTNIGDDAFYSCTSLTSVTIPNSVTSIGPSAFEFCTNLTSVTIGTNVTSIWYRAFNSCFSLTSVTIGNSVTNIGDDAFQSCTSLTAVTVGAFNSAYSSLDGVLFNKSQRTLIQCPARKAGSYTIPKSVNDIGERAFFGCTSLTSVTIPDSVTDIRGFAFSGCTNLTGIYFEGNAPGLHQGYYVYFAQHYDWVPTPVFEGVNAIVYYLPGTTGWIPQVQTTDASFGVQASQFGFTITGTSGLGIVVEACTDLANPTWSPLQTNTLGGDSWFFSDRDSWFFSDPDWTNYPARFYRLWSPTFGGLPTALWSLPNPLFLNFGRSFGLQTNGFGFITSCAISIAVVVEPCTNLANPIWSPVGTNTLTGGSSYFSDPEWTNYPARFYRLRSP